MKAMFFSFFLVLYPVSKQAYMSRLSKKSKIYCIFYVFLLEQNITKKGPINYILQDFEFQIGNNKKYKIDDISNSVVYTKKSAIV